MLQKVLIVFSLDSSRDDYILSLFKQSAVKLADLLDGDRELDHRPMEKRRECLYFEGTAAYNVRGVSAHGR